LLRCGFLGLLFLAAAFITFHSEPRFSGNTFPDHRVSVSPAGVQVKLESSYGKLPLSFELNHGQADERVRFLARGGGYAIYLTGNEAILALRKSSFVSGQSSVVGGQLRGITKTGHRTTDTGAATTNAVVRMRLVGANVKATVTGAEELPGKSNYFIGNDPKKWRTNVPSYGRVNYEGVYPGVDLVYYGNQRQLEYDFVVAPGADPNQIKLSFAGAEGMRIDAASGDLVLKVGDDEMRFRKPTVYQPAVAAVSSPPSNPVAAVYHRRRRSQRAATAKLEGSFVLASNNEVAFRVAGYDPKRALVIDPVLYYSTYLCPFQGFVGMTAIAVDTSGNAYVTGATPGGLPTVNPLQATPKSENITAFVAKLNSTGSALVYSTYLGGSSGDQGFSIAVDSSGNAYVTGMTQSADFPTVNSLQATCSPTQLNTATHVLHCSYPNAFVAKLNPGGSALVYSTYLGSAYTQGMGIAADSAGNAYVTGAYYPPFPGAPGVSGPFVAKLNAVGSALVYFTYPGVGGYGIAVDSSGNAYVIGGGPGVGKLNSDGSALVYSTSLCNECGDAMAIAVDTSGNAYVTGSAGPGLATLNPLQASFGGGDFDAFVAKLDSAGSVVYSTYLGGSGEEVGWGIAVDSSGNAYVTGQTDSTDFPTANAIQANCDNCAAYDTTDVFVAKLNAAGSALVYSTYLGSQGNDFGTGIGVDSSGSAYVTGIAGGYDFPWVNPLPVNYPYGRPVFVAKISPAPVVTASPASLTFGPQGVGTTSAPQTLTLTNTGDAALSVSNVVASGDFAPANNCASPVAVGGSCTISVTFTPTAIGTRSGAITITDNAPGSPQMVSLTGTGTGPAASLTSTSLNFGNQSVGTTSAPQIFTLTDTGTATLTISSLATSGEFAQTNNCGGSVAAGGTCTISVTFIPIGRAGLGAQTGFISISDNASNSPQSVSLSGTGIDTIPPAISISANPSTLWPPNGKSVPVTVSGSITDSGSGVNPSTLACNVVDSYGLVQPSCSVGPLGAGGAYSFTVSLVASREGSDKNGRTYTISVSASDYAGNPASASTTVIVPHDQGN
jgi:hypothetical protein